jgi:hypothetical protein
MQTSLCKQALVGSNGNKALLIVAELGESGREKSVYNSLH